MSHFKTIRETAALGVISEHMLRQLVKRGECPGLYSGRKFLVNVEALSEYLDEKSREGKDNEHANSQK